MSTLAITVSLSVQSRRKQLLIKSGVFYVPSIFLSAAFVFLFLFMEETNYDRSTSGVARPGPEASLEPGINPASPDKPSLAADSPETGSLEAGQTKYKEKTFLQRLSLFDVSRKQRMPYRMLLSLRLVSWPVIFYAGFSYGSYLIWFNVS